MASKNSTVVGIGIDWMTVTAVKAKDSRTLVLSAQSLVNDILPEGTISKPWTAMGYRGQSWGPIKAGARGTDESILILSGATAHKGFGLYPLPLERVTRIDVQVTVALSKPRPTYIEELYKILPSLPKSSKYGKLLTYVSSSTGDSLYIGKRSANTMMRIYDKGGEMGGAKLGSVIRYEMEYRREAAKQVAQALDGHKTPDMYILSLVLAELKKRSILATFAANSSINAIEVKAVVQTLDSQIKWLAKCVAPVVMRAIEAGRTDDALTALKLNHLLDRRH